MIFSITPAVLLKASCLALILCYHLFAGCETSDFHMIADSHSIQRRTPGCYLASTAGAPLHESSGVRNATSREPVASSDGGHYTDRKRDGIRLGVAEVKLGPATWTWEDLIASDRTSTIEEPRPAGVESVREFGTFRGGANLQRSGQPKSSWNCYTRTLG